MTLLMDRSSVDRSSLSFEGGGREYLAALQRGRGGKALDFCASSISSSMGAGGGVALFSRAGRALPWPACDRRSGIEEEGGPCAPPNLDDVRSVLVVG